MSSPALLDWPAIVTVFTASAIGVSIPGANFVAIANKALSASRSEAVYMSFGFALVNSLWAVCGIFGVGAVIAHVAWLGLLLKYLGCLYLVWFGLRLLFITPKAAPATIASTAPPTANGRSAFYQGIGLNILNPKSLLYYCAFLSNVVPASSSGATISAMIFVVGACAVVWYSTLGYLLSFPDLSRRFRNRFRTINRVCGALLVVLGTSEMLFK